MANEKKFQAGERKLSLAMIVRDEEAVLGRCLNAAAPWVDEIVIVDTGSIDGTKAIAAEYGAKTVAFEWCEDFAAARNCALDHCTGDWVLSLDADEVIDEQACKDIREAMEVEKLAGCFVPLTDLSADGSLTHALMFRAFPRLPDIRWKYRIHEQILEGPQRMVAEDGWTLASVDGAIIHDGYQPHTMEAKGKQDRNQKLFELQVADTPQDLYVLYKYADHLRSDPQNADRVLELFERGRQVIEELPETKRRSLNYAGEMLALHSLELVERGRIGEAAEIADYAHQNCYPTANLAHARGHIALRSGHGAEAEDCFRELMEHGGRSEFVPATEDILGWRAKGGLVDAILLQGDKDRAVTVARAQLEEDPEEGELVKIWAKAETLRRDISGFTQRLIDRVQAQPLCGQTWLAGGRHLFSMRLYERALPWIMRATETLEEPDEAHALLGDCFLVMGHHPKAIDAYTEGIASVSCRAGILLMSIAYGLDIEMEVDSSDEELSDALTTLVTRLRRLGETRLSSNLREALLNLEATHPVAHGFLERALA